MRKFSKLSTMHIRTPTRPTTLHSQVLLMKFLSLKSTLQILFYEGEMTISIHLLYYVLILIEYMF